MIVRPESMDFSKQKFSAIIYGAPGVGKTTLALSASNPILIDFDDGVSRVRASHRAPTIVCNTYEDVLADIDSPEIKDFDTIIIDTGGSFVTYLKDWAFRNKPDAKTKSGQFNSLKGFGYVKSEFTSFTNKIKTVLRKNIIYVFHSVEHADKDGNPIQRLMCEGSCRNTVWNPCDFGGYVQMVDNKRIICFSPTQEYFAKGTHGITGEMPIPVLDDKTPNNFLATIFEKARQNIISENDAYAPLKKQYEATMGNVRAALDKVIDLDTANIALSTISNLNHALTSKKEAGAMLNEKAKELGLRFSKDSGCYMYRDGEQ